ncbi:MAG: MarR family winged helix-turn-helix transcriptional regulator [Tabrizicola sp.]
MTDQSDAFDLEDFLPYLLNQAAEATSHDFQAIYRDRYGFTRTQWRVMANLGKFGAMTARDICAISHIEKTKVSRAVAALEEAAMLSRTPSETDRRAEVLSLTPNGQSVFAELGQLAIGFDQRLRETLGAEEARALTAILKRLASRAGPTSDLDD